MGSERECPPPPLPPPPLRVPLNPFPLLPRRMNSEEDGQEVCGGGGEGLSPL